MPQIREYQSRTSAPVLQNIPRVTGDMFGGSAGKGFQAAGRMGREAASKWAKREEERQEFEAQKRSVEEKQKITEFMEQKRKEAPAGAEGFTKQVMDELDARREKALEEAPSEHMRKAMDLSFSQIHLTAFNEAQSFEADSMAKKQRQDLEKIFDKNSNLVRVSPHLAEEYAEEEARLIDRAPIDNTLKQAWKTKRKNEIFESGFEGEVSKLETEIGVTAEQVGKYLVSAKKPGGRWVPNTSAEGYQRYIGRLERLQETLKSKEEQQVFADFDEKMDQMQSTGIRTPENIYTQDWIKANVADPKKRDLMLKREAMADSIGGAMTFVKNAPADKINEEIKKVGEQRKSTGEFHVVDGKYQALIQAKKHRDTAFVRDQAAYISSISPAIQQIQAELVENPTPEKAHQYAEMQAAEQKRLYPGVQPKILNQVEIGRIAAQMSAVTYDEKGAAEAVQVLQAEAVKWGKHWPTVVRDLSSGKKPALNSSQYVAASMMNKPEYKHISEDILKAASVPRKQLLKELPDGIEKATYLSAKESLADFRKSLEGLPAGQGEAVVNSYAEAMTQYALFKQSRGESVELEDLADKIVNESYEFEDTYRIPSNLPDTSIVKSGVESIFTSIDDLELANIPTTTPETGFLRPEDINSRYKSNLLRNGKIYTKGDDSGVRVTDGIGNQVYVKKDGKIVPLEYTWSELRVLGSGKMRQREINRELRGR